MCSDFSSTWRTRLWSFARSTFSFAGLTADAAAWMFTAAATAAARHSDPASTATKSSAATAPSSSLHNQTHHESPSAASVPTLSPLAAGPQSLTAENALLHGLRLRDAGPLGVRTIRHAAMARRQAHRALDEPGARVRYRHDHSWRGDVVGYLHLDRDTKLIVVAWFTPYPMESLAREDDLELCRV